MRASALLVLGLAVSCGGSSTGTTTGGGMPTQHRLVDNETASVAGGQTEGRLFSIPRAATVRYEIVDVPAQPGFNDAMDIVIQKDSDFSIFLSTGATVPGYGFHGMAASIVSEDIALPAAGDYDLVVTCNNFSTLDCVFQATVIATY
jgi:hypothetical protein